MRKIMIISGTWIMALMCVLVFSCNEDLERVPPIIDPNKVFDGEWNAVYVELNDVTGTKNLRDYFKDFKVKIINGVAICNINGYETWVAIKEWKDNCNIFENIYDRNTMLFDIKSASNGQNNFMTVCIQKEEPGFSFLPEKWNTGKYNVTFKK